MKLQEQGKTEQARKDLGNINLNYCSQGFFLVFLINLTKLLKK